MAITCRFSCDGCDAEATSKPLKRRFESVSGRSWGFGTYRYQSVFDVAPEGWMAFDPYTGCTYCPDCWDGIVEHMYYGEG